MKDLSKVFEIFLVVSFLLSLFTLTIFAVLAAPVWILLVMAVSGVGYVVHAVWEALQDDS